MKLEHWFNVEDIAHIRAYKNVIETGVWPDGFLPYGVEITPNSVIEISFVLARTYVNKRIINDDHRNTMRQDHEKYLRAKREALASKPKADEVVVLMKQGWSLQRTSSLRSEREYYSMYGSGSQRKDVNGQTVLKLLRENKIVALPNPYVMTKPTIYKLVEPEGGDHGKEGSTESGC
jgi:hypothetical protein